MFGQMPRWRLFSFRGNTVFLEPLFLLLVAFFVFTGVSSADHLVSNLLWIPILFVGVLWHEFGHAFAIQRYGYGPSTIILQGLGGVTINQRRGSAPSGKSIAISLAGPIFSLSLTLVFGLAYFLYPAQNLVGQFFYLMALINGIWAVFNMLPIAPLDGGHVVLHALRAKFPQRKALLYSAYSSIAALVLFSIPLILFLDPLFTIILGLLFAAHNWRVIQAVNSRAY